MDKNIVVRKVKSVDAEQFIRLRNYVWRDAYKHIFPEEVFEYRDLKVEENIKNFDKKFYNDNTRICYVAEDGDKIVGVMFGQISSEYDYFKEKGYADLEVLYIHPEYQGMGIAGKMKNLFIDWLKERGIKKYVIGVLKDNLNARKVYEKWGGFLEDYSKKFVMLNVGYDEVFYTYNINN